MFPGNGKAGTGPLQRVNEALHLGEQQHFASPCLPKGKTMISAASPQDEGEQHRKRKASRSREIYSAVADIGEYPPVVNPKRRAACERDLLRYLTTYFPFTTGLKPFSQKHIGAIKRLELAILKGGRFLNILPRGFAKSTISENAAIWATSYGHRLFIPVFGANRPAADGMIDSIKTELSDNDLLYDDFPEICHAFRALEGKPQRCRSQTYRDELTHIRWTASSVVFPTMPESKASGAIIITRGLTAGIRGMKYKRPDGKQQRPDFVIIDDPQTDKGADSALQIQKILKTIRKSILRLGGHNRRLAVCINATIIEQDDVVCHLQSDPSWQSIRVKMVEKFPDSHESFWMDEYATVRNTYDRDDPADQPRAHRDANKLYVQNRKRADKGGIVTWEHCYEEGEVSALQHAYNILIDDGPEVFYAECQNEPLTGQEDSEFLSSGEILTKLSGHERRVIPASCHRLTAFIDVHDKLLYYAVCAWADGFTGYVVDYGAWPKPTKSYFSMREIKSPTLGSVSRGSGKEGSIHNGLGKLTAEILGRAWKRDDGVAMSIDQCLIDEGYETDTIYGFCRQSPYANIIIPSKGFSVTASSNPFNEYKKKPGERRGNNWRQSRVVGGHRALRHIVFDTNFWKTFIQTRLTTSIGDKGSLLLWGDEATADHRMFADHLTSEVPIETEGRGRVVTEWHLPPSKPDNHLLDCIVGCAVGAAMEGVALPNVEAKATHRKRTEWVPLAELRRRKRENV